jgi:hypothetical protein
VRSIWALEVLLLLRRRAPAALTPDEIVAALRASLGLITRIIDQLVAASLIVRNASGGVRFECDPAIAKLCDALDQAAHDRPIALRDAIASSPDDKLRNFSDAFRLTSKDKPEGKDEKGDDQ